MGEPLKEIKGTASGKVIFRFDSKGEFFTDDAMIISRATGHFDHQEYTAEPCGEIVKRTITTPQIQITKNEDETKPEPEPSGDKYICKYCGEEFEKSGQRLAHYAHGCPKKEN